jgi:predicted O-methyltransferase YrrM
VAGVADQVTIMIGPAAESLTKLSPEKPFDLVFIDADKVFNSIYFSAAKQLVRKGGVIVGLSLISSTILRRIFVD